MCALCSRSGLPNLAKACRQAKHWLDSGRPTVVSVNVSIVQLRHAAFPVRLAETLRKFDLPGEWIELEVTESAAMTDVAVTVEVLEALQRAGVRIAIDDFGTAYSSLSYLKILPIDTLKIDRSFILDLKEDGAEDSHEAAIIRAIVALGQALDLYVVAEGVETEEQKRFLLEVGCKEGQGYLFGEPRPGESYEGVPTM